MLPAGQDLVVPSTSDEYELVWQEGKPRMRRKMRMGTAFAAPDFEAASSRATNTARQLGLQPLPVKKPPPPPKAVATLDAADEPPSPRARPFPLRTTSQPRALPLRTRTAPNSGGGASAGRETWLAEQGELELEVASRVEQLERGMGRKEADDVRRAVGGFARAWANPASLVDAPRLHLQKPVFLEEVLSRMGRQADMLAAAAGPTEWSTGSTRDDESSAGDEIRHTRASLAAFW